MNENLRMKRSENENLRMKESENENLRMKKSENEISETNYNMVGKISRAERQLTINMLFCGFKIYANIKCAENQ